MSSTTFAVALLVLISFALLAEAQFFFPFGNGMAQIPAQQPAQASGYGYRSYGNGVKDSEGFFALCRGWTCN